MVIEEMVSNLSEFVVALPPTVWARVEGLILILKTIGILFIIYFVYSVFMAVLNFRKLLRIKRMEKRINSIDRKLDLLVGKKKKKKKS